MDDGPSARGPFVENDPSLSKPPLFGGGGEGAQAVASRRSPLPRRHSGNLLERSSHNAMWERTQHGVWDKPILIPEKGETRGKKGSRDCHAP